MGKNTGYIGICVDDSHALEGGGGLDGGEVVDITNKLSVVVLDDGSADDIRARREVHQGWRVGRRVAALAAALARGDGRVDGDRVVGGAIALGAKVLDVAEDLVALL